MPGGCAGRRRRGAAGGNMQTAGGQQRPQLQAGCAPGGTPAPSVIVRTALRSAQPLLQPRPTSNTTVHVTSLASVCFSPIPPDPAAQPPPTHPPIHPPSIPWLRTARSPGSTAWTRSGAHLRHHRGEKRRRRERPAAGPGLWLPRVSVNLPAPVPGSWRLLPYTSARLPACC